jgi:stalled ribosome rescue protein Dom34
MGATRVLLAGDEVAIPILREVLPARTAELVHDEVLRIDVRAPQDTVRDEIAPILAAVEAEEDRALADPVVEAVRGNGLGSAGLRSTRQALEQGQVDTLLLVNGVELDEETRAELVRLAATTSAEVAVVDDHPGLRQLGGVGALLRYRYD